jgi:cell division protein FtsB
LSPKHVLAPELDAPASHVLLYAAHVLDYLLVTGLGKITTLRPLRNFVPQLLLTILLGLGLLQLTIWTGLTLYRHMDAAQAASLEQLKINELKLEVKVLKERATQARQDKLYLERLARKQGFVKSGETVIVPKVR